MCYRQSTEASGVVVTSVRAGERAVGALVQICFLAALRSRDAAKGLKLGFLTCNHLTGCHEHQRKQQADSLAWHLFALSDSTPHCLAASSVYPSGTGRSDKLDQIEYSHRPDSQGILLQT